ncbi:basic proline-rich protein-like [Mesoplodon densirostris]|uniref:basic proline-rich protein-like n=1 Tax=Mesoplodon densirostris TaxID=48708 RepID=UPI0028DCC950|nr:basic proline-rich protein-like [Mesoplodon densirostris]
MANNSSSKRARPRHLVPIPPTHPFPLRPPPSHSLKIQKSLDRGGKPAQHRAERAPGLPAAAPAPQPRWKRSLRPRLPLRIRLSLHLGLPGSPKPENHSLRQGFDLPTLPGSREASRPVAPAPPASWSRKPYKTGSETVSPRGGSNSGEGRGGGRDPEPGAGTLGSGWARVAPVRGLRPPVAPRSPGGGEVGRPRYLEDQGGPRPGSHLRRAPPARSPAPIHPDASRAPVGARSPRARVGGARRRSAESGSRSSNGDARRLGLSARGAGAAGGAGPGGRRDAGDAGAPGTPAHTRTQTPVQHRPGAAPPGEGICPRSAPAAAATRTSLSAGPPPPRPSPPERRAPRPPPLSAPARSAPRNSRPAHFKGPPGTSKRAGRPPPRPRTHQGSARALRAQTSRAPRAGPRPRPRPPDRLAAAAPGPPGPVPASGNMGESRGRGGSAGNPAAREGAEARPAAPLSAQDPSGPRPSRGRPRPLRPPPGPAFDTGPASSSHSGHPTSSGRFQQKLRRGFHCALQRRVPAHGPEREVRARRAPGRPRRPRRPSPGPSGSRTPSRPPLGRAGPPPAPCALDAAGRDLAPGPGGARLRSGSAGAAPPPPPFTAQLSPGETGASDARRPGDP